MLGVDDGVMQGRETTPDDALTALYEREWGPLLRVAFLLVGSQSIAEEIVQDAFVSLQASRSEVRSPGAYLRVSVINACRSVHRHRAVIARNPVQPWRNEQPAEYDDLRDAVQKLPYRQRAVLILRYHLQLNESEIATALACRPGTVRSSTHRALAALRKDLS